MMGVHSEPSLSTKAGGGQGKGLSLLGPKGLVHTPAILSNAVVGISFFLSLSI